jgi:tRNA A-37 threonylcarbamoyl transferase component Bud32
MSTDHQKIKALFLEAIELPLNEQNDFVTSIENETIKKEVTSLVKNHIEDFTITVDSTAQSKIQPLPKTNNTLVPKIYKLLFGNRFKLGTTLFIISLLLLAVGFFTLSQGKKALVEIRSNELKNMIESNQLTMNVWIEEQENLVEILSKAPSITSKINCLTTTYGFGKDGNPNIIWQDSVHQSLIKFLEPILKSEGIPLFSVLDKTGYRIATNEQKDLGGQVTTEGLSTILSVFTEQKITFTRPTLHRLHKTSQTQGVEIPLTWIDAPIYDTTGKIIATLGLAYFADEGFSKFLNIQKAGQQGESYAFDKNGLLVSHSKYRTILQNSGIIQKNQKSILNTTLRNPQIDLETTSSPPKNYASLPFIVPVANLLAHLSSDTILKEVITEPYLNYVGKEVMGAAVWLPKYNFGIVTEIPTSEAFAPLDQLAVLFISLFLLLLSLAIYSTLSTFSLFTISKASMVKIGPYFIKQKIGEGGMGDVFLAEHQLLKRPTAIKTLKKEILNTQNEQRFQREVLLASKLTHPNTINIYDFGPTEDGSFYFAMEYLKGIHLGQLTAICGTLSSDRVVCILLQICYSLKEAHHKGLVHRDIKPQNIMLCYIGDMYDVVKVLDFGLVKDIENKTNEDLTQLFEIGGTPMYMSPERLTAPSTVDYRTDIYSVGVIAYSLLTGQKPFLTGINDADVINQVINEKPKKMSVSGVPNELSQLIYCCLEKDPNDRPADMSELIALLGKVDQRTWTQQLAEKWWKENNTPKNPELDILLN